LGEFEWEQWRRLTCGVGYRISRPTLKSPGPQVMAHVVREVVKCRHMINLLSAQNHMLNLLIYSIFGFICLVECLLYPCHDCIKISLKDCLRDWNVSSGEFSMLCTFITSVANCNCYFCHVDFFSSRCTLAAFGTYVESITLIFELSEFSIAKSCSPFIFNSLSTCAIISHMPEY